MLTRLLVIILSITSIIPTLSLAEGQWTWENDPAAITEQSYSAELNSELLKLTIPRSEEYKLKIVGTFTEDNSGNSRILYKLVEFETESGESGYRERVTFSGDPRTVAKRQTEDYVQALSAYPEQFPYLQNDPNGSEYEVVYKTTSYDYWNEDTNSFNFPNPAKVDRKTLRLNPSTTDVLASFGQMIVETELIAEYSGDGAPKRESSYIFREPCRVLIACSKEPTFQFEASVKEYNTDGSYRASKTDYNASGETTRYEERFYDKDGSLLDSTVEFYDGGALTGQFEKAAQALAPTYNPEEVMNAYTLGYDDGLAACSKDDFAPDCTEEQVQEMEKAQRKLAQIKKKMKSLKRNRSKRGLRKLRVKRDMLQGRIDELGCGG